MLKHTLRAHYLYAPVLFVTATALCMFTGSAAFAGGMETAVNDILGEAKNVAPLLGTIALIALGIGAMNGRITWTQALVVAIGIVIASDPEGVASAVR